MSNNTATFDELVRIYEANNRVLTPKAVVDASRPDDAPLHDRFEWDDSVASELYREQQAAHIIRTVHVTRFTDIARGPVRVRAFLATAERADEPDTGSWQYTAVSDLSPGAVEAILRQMEKDVAALLRKYRDHRDALDRMLRERKAVP